MAIKKRSSLPDPNSVAEPLLPGLQIVAKQKKPMPAANITTIYGDDPTPAQLRKLGNIALSCRDTPGEDFNVTDRIKMLRTPFDRNNPQELRYRNRVKNRATAITAMCIVCTGSRKAVTECLDTTCPLWAYRMGSDPFYKQKK